MLLIKLHQIHLINAVPSFSTVFWFLPWLRNLRPHLEIKISPFLEVSGEYYVKGTN